MIRCTYGTGAFLLMNTGNKPAKSANGLLTTVAFQIGRSNPPIYALEGAVAYCGSTIQWLRDNMQMISDLSESETLASKVSDNGGIYFVPAFAGLFAPYWREDARGLVIGLTAFNTKEHICRAALEATSFQVKEVVEAMQVDSSLNISILKVDGGLTKNNLAMQFQSDILRIPLVRPTVSETTSMGVAFATGLALGFWKDMTEIEQVWKTSKSWQPCMDNNQSEYLVSIHFSALIYLFVIYNLALNYLLYLSIYDIVFTMETCGE
jgi:glycerol kinase